METVEDNNTNSAEDNGKGDGKTQEKDLDISEDKIDKSEAANKVEPPEDRVVERDPNATPHCEEHHILSPLQAKLLKRSEQDALFQEKGGRARGRGKGRVGDEAEEEVVQGVLPITSSTKSRKDSMVRTLFPEDLEIPDDPEPDGDVAEPSSSAAAPKKKPAGKSRARKASPKKAPKAKAKAKATAKRFAAKSRPKSKAKKEEEGVEIDEKSDAAQAGSPKLKRQRKQPAKKPSIEEDKVDKKSKVTKLEVPVFSCSTVVPYWSRNACGLKVPKYMGAEAGEGEGDQDGLKQVFYIGVKGATMKEHLDIIVDMVT